MFDWALNTPLTFTNDTLSFLQTQSLRNNMNKKIRIFTIHSPIYSYSSRTFASLFALVIQKGVPMACDLAKTRRIPKTASVCFLCSNRRRHMYRTVLKLWFEGDWYFCNVADSGWFWKQLSRNKVPNNHFLKPIRKSNCPEAHCETLDRYFQSSY